MTTQDLADYAALAGALVLVLGFAVGAIEPSVGALVGAGTVALVAALLWIGRGRRLADTRSLDEATASLARLRRAHETTTKSAEVKTRILVYASHEFRTPMQAIVGISGLLAAPRMTDEQRLGHAATLRTAAEGMLRLVDGILDWSRIESGAMSMRAEAFSPRAVFTELLDLLRPHAEAKGLALSADLAGDLPQAVTGDPWRVRQVTTNLIGNAIKYTRRGSVKLRVTSRIDEGIARLTVEVVDTGPGIPAADLPHLFQPFGRLQTAGNGRAAGTGLGLAISKHIVELFGGKIDVESTVGAGSTFRYEIGLPLTSSSALPPPPIPPGRMTPRSSPAATAPAPPRPVVPAAPAAEAAPRRRVLVADDDPTMRHLLELMLDRMGYSVDTVEDGSAAIERATVGEHDAVILDVEMPAVDGPTAARRIRGQNDDIAILILSGHIGMVDSLRCREAGVDAVLTKPVTLEDLQETLSRAIDTKAGGVDFTMIRGLVGGAEATRGTELLDVFLRETQRDVELLSDAVARSDREAVRKATHRLGGGSAAFGAVAIAEACKALNDAANGDAPMTAELERLLDAARRATAAFTHERERMARLPRATDGAAPS